VVLVTLALGCEPSGAAPALCLEGPECPPLAASPLRPVVDRLLLRESPANSVGLDIRAGAVVHLRTDEAGAFPSLSWLQLGSSPRDVLLQDLNGDGVHDLAVSDTYGGHVSVALGGPDGAFSRAAEIPLSGGPAALAGWPNPDGGTRLLVASGHTSSLWSIELASEGPATISEFLALPPGVSTMVATDLDFDGVQELVASNPSTGRIDTLTYQARTWAVSQSVPVSFAVSRLQFGRFDGDAYADLLLVDDATRTAHVLPGLAAGAFSSAAVALDSPGPVVDAVPWGISLQRPVLLVEDFGLVEAPIDGPAMVLGFTLKQASSIGRPGPSDGSLAVVAKDAGRIAWYAGREDALALGDAIFLQALETAYPLLAVDASEDGIPDIVARDGTELVVFPALAPDAWGARIPIDLEVDADIVAIHPVRSDLDAHLDLLAVDSQSRLLALGGGGDGTFVHEGTHSLWATGAEFRVADMQGDGRSELIVTRRDLMGAPRELWQFDGAQWTAQPLPGAGGRPVFVRPTELVFASSDTDGTPAFLERVVPGDGGWKLDGRTELPAHIAELTPTGGEDSSGFAFCLDGSADRLPSIGRRSSGAPDGLEVTIEAVEPTPVLYDGRVEHLGGACTALWSVQGPEHHELVAHFRFVSGIDALDAFGMFELTTDDIIHYRSEYVGTNVSTVVPLVAGSEWRGVLVKNGLFTDLRGAAERPAMVARRTMSIWPEDTDLASEPLAAPPVRGGPGGFLLPAEGTSTILAVAHTGSLLDGFTVPCLARRAVLADSASALVVCDDGSLLHATPRAAPVSLGSLPDRVDAMAAWDSMSGLFLLTGDAEAGEVRRYRVDPTNHTAIPIDVARTEIAPALLRIVSRAGSDALLVAEPGESSVVLLDPAALAEGPSTQIVSLRGEAAARLEVGDLDDDGSSELFVLMGGMLRIYTLSRPPEPLLAELALPDEVDETGSFAVLDVDCDDVLDLAVLAEGSQRLLLWRGDGSGGFARDGELEFPQPLRALVGGRCAPGMKSMLALGDSEVFLR